jgi:transcriptional regulator with XRE-family HTH domain
MSDTILSQSEHQKVVGSRLRRVVAMLGMSLVDAADVMGVSKQTFNDYVKGKTYPNSYAVYRLHRAKGVTYDFLFLGDWSALPAKLAAAMDAELRVEMDAALGRDRVGAESP